MKRDLKTITPRALSIKLTDLMEWGLVEKNVVSTSPVNIIYQLTDKGNALAAISTNGKVGPRIY